MVVEIVKPEAPVEGEEVSVPTFDLFTLEGVTYSVPMKVRPNISLRYLLISRMRSEDEADEWLGMELMGFKAYFALINCEYIGQEQSDEIWRTARAIAFGELRPKAPEESAKEESGDQPAPKPTSKPTNGSRKRGPKQQQKATSAASTE